MEVITVTGRDIDNNLDFALNKVTTSLTELGVYDGRRTGTKVSRQRAGQQNLECEMIFWEGDTSGAFFSNISDLFGMEPFEASGGRRP